MTIDTNENYSDLIDNGYYSKALSVLSSIETKTFEEKHCEAFILFRMGQNEKSIDITNTLLSKLNKEDDVLLYLKTKFLLINIQIEMGFRNKAFDSLSKETKYVEQINHDEIDYIRSKIDYLWGCFHLAENDVAKAIDKLKQAENRINSKSYPIDYSLILHELGVAHKRINDFNNAESYYKKALEIKTKLSDKNYLVKTLNHLAILNLQYGKIDEGGQYFKKILDHRKYLEDNIEFAKTLNNLGIFYRQRGHFEQAIDYFEQSLEISTRLENDSNIVNCLINMGNVYSNQAEYDEALINYRKVLPIVRRLNDKRKLLTATMNIGILHKDLGEFQQAEYYFSKAIILSKELNDHIKLAKCYGNLGGLFLATGQLRNSKSYHEKALKLFDDVDDKLSKSLVMNNLGIVYQKLNNYEEACKFFKASYDIQKELGNDLAISDILFQLIQNEMAFGNFTKAEEYLKEIKKINKNSDNHVIKSRTKLAEANLLYNSSDGEDQFIAHELLEEVLRGKYVNFELNVFAIITLCEYLIIEFKRTKSEEILNELIRHVNKLYEMAEKNDSNDLIAKTLIIQAKLALVKKDPNEAIYYLKQARDIAENQLLDEILIKISYLENMIQESLYDIGEIDNEKRMDQITDELEIEEYIKNLHYQKLSQDILMTDIENIQKFNSDLVNILKFKDSSDKNIKNYAKIVQLSGQELKVLYSTLKIFQKLDTQSYTPQHDQIDLQLVLRDKLSIYEVGFNKKNISSSIEMSDHPIIVTTDHFLLSKIVDHLLLNVIKFTPKNGSFNLRIIESDESIRVHFDNNTREVLDDKLEMFFEKYFQYSPIKTTIRGYGIGLTFCKQATDLLGHQINIYSPIPGQKDGFRVELILNRKIST